MSGAVMIEMAGRRIRLQAAFKVAGLSKTVPGASFSKGERGAVGPHWSIPLSMEACLALRERFGPIMEIGPDLTAWAIEEKRKLKAMAALSSAGDAELRHVPAVSPQLDAAMASRTYQRVGARFIAEGRNVLIADQPGLGKTLECLGGIIERQTPGPYLVVCPKTAVETVWAREIPRWVPGAEVLTLPEGRAAREAILNRLRDRAQRTDAADDLANTWLVVNPETCRVQSYWTCKHCDEETPRKAGKTVLACGHGSTGHGTRHDYTFPQLFGKIWGAIVVDESDRSLLRAVGRLTQTRNGMEMLRDATRLDGIRIAMSGTPFRGRPHLLWSTLNWLWPDRYTSMWNWMETFWHIDDGGYGGSRTVGAMRTDMEAKLWESLTPILLRRTKAEVAKDMPPKTYAGTPMLPEDPRSPIGVWIPMEKAQAKAYREMLETSVASVAGGTLSAVGILAEMTRLKQFATSAGKMTETGRTAQGEPQYSFAPALPSNKFAWLEEKLEEWGFPEDPDTKIIVVSQFTQTLNLFAAELAGRRVRPIPSCMITGEVTGARRRDVIERFNTEQGPHLMFLNTKAGGVAITIDTADRMVFLDETWIPDDQEQAEDRIHRVSNPRNVEYHYLRSLDSIDAAIALVTQDRAEATGRLLDGRRGVEYGRRIMERASKL